MEEKKEKYKEQRANRGNFSSGELMSGHHRNFPKIISNSADDRHYQEQQFQKVPWLNLGNLQPQPEEEKSKEEAGKSSNRNIFERDAFPGLT